ncbi:mannose-1-phosphate guanylyltransferase [Pedobacter psychrodurus]|uniref:mannose-1-phosphate guanylyltransferase n=1 Tax=Pedobacter psychrodurus TaxID=2530456 RepID=UPI00292D1FC6|nr:mannose-1-phosphate guanylyltransferase [Pedobacter psychrodurus]
MKNNTYVLIMAGGVGSRFWPKSRNSFPKQFIDILGVGKSLLQLTYERFLTICPRENIYILSNSQYDDLISAQLTGISKDNIILEPSRNNTAPCITYASFKIAEINPDANIIVAPSDHLILNEAVFLTQVKLGLDYAAENDALVTLGINPTRPDTGYGYINYINTDGGDIHQVIRFMEKPDLQRATEFIKTGGYVWNAGIFIWNVSSILKALSSHAPEIYNLFLKGKEFYNTETENTFISENYPFSPNISIDYAVMEKADNVFTITGEFGWSDLGTWASLHEVSEKDTDNNSVNSRSVHLAQSSNCIVQLPKDKVAVIRGLNDFIIVDDGDVLLIYPKSEEQEIKKVSGLISEKFGNSFL